MRMQMFRRERLTLDFSSFLTGARGFLKRSSAPVIYRNKRILTKVVATPVEQQKL